MHDDDLPPSGPLSAAEPSGSPKHERLVEVVDRRNRPLAALSMREAHRQGLNHRAVVVLVFDTAGRIYLQKRSRSRSLYPGRWDLSAGGHVLLGESLTEAGAREISEELGLHVESLRLVAELPAKPETGNEFLTVFAAGHVHQEPRPNPAEAAEGCFYAQDEVSCLVREFRELITPALAVFHEARLLFPDEAP